MKLTSRDRSQPGRSFIHWGLTALSGVLLIIVAGGCGVLSPGPKATGGKTAQADGTPEPTENLPAAIEGPCANRYYPISPGVKKNYRLSSKNGGREIGLTQETGAGESFKEERKFSTGIQVVTNWRCTDKGLRMAEYTNFIDTKSAAFDMETLESSGVTIPKVLAAGKKWKSEYKVKANLNVGPVSASAGGKVVINHALESLDERIIVPGGEFETAKVNSVIEIRLTMRGRPIPAKRIRVSVWYSPKVGLVKQRVYGDFGEETIEFTGMQ